MAGRYSASQAIRVSYRRVFVHSFDCARECRASDRGRIAARVIGGGSRVPLGIVSSVIGWRAGTLGHAPRARLTSPPSDSWKYKPFSNLPAIPSQSKPSIYPFLHRQIFEKLNRPPRLLLLTTDTYRF